MIQPPEQKDKHIFSERQKSHYSYSLYEKDEVTQGFDKARFGGKIGHFFSDHQENLIFEHIGNPENLRILDLGAGTGRTSLPLSHRKANVTAADASMKMLRITQEKAYLQGTEIHLSRVDAHTLPFANQAFDLALSFRMIMHVTNWQKALSELCRVTKNMVIVDFPPKCGFAGLVPLVHPLIRTFNKNHQSYRIFTVHEVVEQLNRNGFRIKTVDRHLVLPFGLHRKLNLPRVSRFTEQLLAKLKIQKLFGAPVTLIAIRNSDTGKN